MQTADMLDLDVPALRGGKPIIVESEPDWYVTVSYTHLDVYKRQR